LRLNFLHRQKTVLSVKRRNIELTAGHGDEFVLLLLVTKNCLWFTIHKQSARAHLDYVTRNCHTTFYIWIHPVDGLMHRILWIVENYDVVFLWFFKLENALIRKFDALNIRFRIIFWIAFFAGIHYRSLQERNRNRTHRHSETVSPFIHKQEVAHQKCSFHRSCRDAERLRHKN